MPAAGAVGDEGGWEAVLAVRPDLAAPAARAAELAAGGAHRPAPELVAALAAADPEAADALVTLVAGAYYLDTEVCRLLGYPGQEAQVVNAHEFPAYVAEGLLDGVPTPAGTP
jgi:hypothetical protein